MTKDKSRIQSCIDHINTAVDVDPWAKELVIEMGAEILKQLNNTNQELNNANQELNNANDCISRQAAIDTEGLDEQIRCEMCRNPMHTDRGCDGNCKYDEKLYERIMQILGERIKPLPSVQPDVPDTNVGDLISRQAAIRWVKTECNPYGKPTLDFESGKRVMEHLKTMPSVQPETVRCKNCRWQKDQSGSTAWLPCRALITPSDFYCGRAERRIDGTEQS